MGQIANILDATLAPPAMLPSSTPPAEQESRLTRLVPGSSRSSADHRLREWLTVEDVRSWSSSLCTTVVTGVALHYSHSNVPNSLHVGRGIRNFLCAGGWQKNLDCDCGSIEWAPERSGCRKRSRFSENHRRRSPPPWFRAINQASFVGQSIQGNLRCEAIQHVCARGIH